MNKFLVGAGGQGVVIMNPPRGPISEDDALNLIAWIAVLAGIDAKEADAAIDAVQSERDIPKLAELRAEGSEGR